MKIFISDFQKSVSNPLAIAISREVPPDFKGRRIIGLSIPASVSPDDSFETIWRAYKQLVLVMFDPQIILDIIGDSAVLIGENKRHCLLFCRWLELYSPITVYEL